MPGDNSLLEQIKAAQKDVELGNKTLVRLRALLLHCTMKHAPSVSVEQKIRIESDHQLIRVERLGRLLAQLTEETILRSQVGPSKIQLHSRFRKEEAAKQAKLPS